MNFLEYDDRKLKEDGDELTKIISELKDDINNVFINKGELLLNVIDCQNDLITNINDEKNRLLGICMELEYITGCIVKSRDNYIKCEEKISELLEKLKIGVI